MSIPAPESLAPTQVLVASPGPVAAAEAAGATAGKFFPMAGNLARLPAMATCKSPLLIS